MNRFLQRCFELTSAIAFLALTTAAVGAESARVRTLRLPDGCIWPQAMKDDRGVLHLIYYKGDPAAGDVFYVRSSDDGATFSPPLRVNSQKGSAIAIGTVRGPQMALGRSGRPHVAWMGSDKAEPRVQGKFAPMLYTRLNEAGDGFESQRNVIQAHPGLDGGGSVAADADGNVYVAWHAPETPGAGEADRWIWIAASKDDGKTFAAEKAANPNPTGACGCCGMRIFADSRGAVQVLYRTATASVNRDIHLLVSQDRGTTFIDVMADPWNVATCVMSTAAFAEREGVTAAAWETRARIHFGVMNSARPSDLRQLEVEGTGRNPKHPAVAINHGGEILLAWTEGTGWNTGGSVAWQVFDAHGKPVSASGGARKDLPTWDAPAAFTASDGTFVVVY